ncbi:MAG: hypothetical protein HY303_01250 [Candidatus Wallbacteria bacterium]|nr:hypothetical protein [Candidatus Wallbacteria bacterium]
MRIRWFLAVVIGAAVVTAIPSARAEYPEQLEVRFRQELARALSGTDYGTAYRACLLTPDEVLVEIVLESPEAAEPARDSLAVEQARQQVVRLLGTRYPRLRLSELSIFKMKGQPAPQMYALQPER